MQDGFALQHIPAAEIGEEVDLGGGEFDEIEQVFVYGEVVGEVAEGAEGEEAVAEGDLFLQEAGELLFPTGNAVVVDPADFNVPAAGQPPPFVGLGGVGLDGDEG